ncbi:MAG TPA: DUF3175 domain-containing protein [Steroidobacteraceae bacterium]
MEPARCCCSAPCIALSLKRSAMVSRRRKLLNVMLNFEINRAGKNLSPERRRVLNQAKQELRNVFGRAEAQAN